jgi:hypothetical protein
MYVLLRDARMEDDMRGFLSKKEEGISRKDDRSIRNEARSRCNVRVSSPGVAPLILKEGASTASVGFPMNNARPSMGDVGASISDECPLICAARLSMTI